MAALDCARPGWCSCGWGCAKKWVRPFTSCRLLGRCECGWQCLKPRDEPLRITWSQAFQSQRLADRRLSVARSNRCFRLDDLAYIASRFDCIILSFRTIEQIHKWFWWLADQQRIADRKLALAVSFNSTVNSARWTLPSTQRCWADKTVVHWPSR